MTRKATQKSSRTKTGNCFDMNGVYFLDHCEDNQEEKFWICHGVVLHAEDDFPMLHCWIEVSRKFKYSQGEFTIEYCLDKSNGNDVDLPKEVYYKAGRMKKVVRYKYEEFRRRLREENTWGAWEDHLVNYPNIVL